MISLLQNHTGCNSIQKQSTIRPILEKPESIEAIPNPSPAFPPPTWFATAQTLRRKPTTPSEDHLDDFRDNTVQFEVSGPGGKGMYYAADGLGRRRRIHPQVVIDWSGKTCGIDEKNRVVFFWSTILMEVICFSCHYFLFDFIWFYFFVVASPLHPLLASK